MNNLPEDILRIILHNNEHALCCRQFYRVIIDNLQILRWIRTVLYKDVSAISRLSYASIYHHVYRECILKRCHIVDMSFNIAMREFGRSRSDRLSKGIKKHSGASLPISKRFQMVVDILMYWNKTRKKHVSCVCHRMKMMTGVYPSGTCNRCNYGNL